VEVGLWTTAEPRPADIEEVVKKGKWVVGNSKEPLLEKERNMLLDREPKATEKQISCGRVRIAFHKVEPAPVIVKREPVDD